MNLIALETSTSYLSLAVSKDGRVHARHLLAEQRHAEIALDELLALLAEAGLEFAQVQGIAYGEGPGAFTGLRIACGMAQGLAFSRALPVVGVPTLLAVAEASGESRVQVCIDARMSEVYHAAYVREAGQWREACEPGLCPPADLPLPEGERWVGCGSGFAAYGPTLAERLAGRLVAVREDIQPTAEIGRAHV